MTEADLPTGGIADRASLAATILEEEDRRLREAAVRDAAHAPVDDAYLDAPLLAHVEPSGGPLRAELGATRARVHRLATSRNHALVLAATGVGLGGVAAATLRATGVAAVVVLGIGAIGGCALAANTLRDATRRDAAALLRRGAQALAAAVVGVPMAAALPDLLGVLALVAVVAALVRAAVLATSALAGVTAGEGPAGRVVVLGTSVTRLACFGLAAAWVLGLALGEASPMRALVLGGVPAALAAAGGLWSMAGAVSGDLVAAASQSAHLDATLIATRNPEGDEAAPVALEIRHVDFSYGHVQVLFDVSVDVHHGEVLALLGTNGAGKSTLLRAVSGLSPIDRGTIRHRGTDITFADPGTRVRGGIVQLPGGKAIFPSLTVVENLLAGGYTHIWDKPRLAAKIEEVVGIFPVLRDRLDQPAGTLSGGEQQMLAFAKALLLDPDVLCIDELSLGLAPVVVQELLAIVERLKADGLTMVIVEQSLNVALALADRAVFMEKGRVRFDGPARELAERGDLARAVFLGGEGG